MRKIIFSIFIFLPFVMFSQKQIGKIAEKVQSSLTKPGKFKSYDVFKSGHEKARTNYSDAVDKGVIVTFDEAKVTAIYNENPQQVEITIPIKTNGETVTLELYQKDIFSPDFRARTNNGRDITDEIDRGMHFRGIVNGNSQSLVSISIFRNEILGFVSFSDKNYIIGKLKDSESNHIIYQDSDLRQTEEFICATEDDGVGYTREELTYTDGNNRDPNDCVNIYIEAGQSVYNSFGGNLTNTTNFLIGVFAQSYVIYANEGITMQTSDMFVWTTADPYSGPTAGDYKTQFQGNTGQSAFNGDLGHLVEVDNVGGQAAGFAGICAANTDDSLCFSGFSGTGFNNVPTYSFNVYIITHEMGHLLGSRHTHACVWNGNSTAIDGCAGFTEGGCSLPPAANPGTIMSYCTPNVSFAQGFGPQPNAVINNTVNAPGNCLGGCGPVSNDSCSDATNMNYGDTLSGTTTGATFDNVGTCVTTNTAPGVWYTFTGDGNENTLTTCSSANYDTKISVFSGTCAALNCEGGNDNDSSCAGGMGRSTVDICTTIGTDYYVLVHGFNSATGDFDLTLTSTPSGPAISCPGNITQDNDTGICGAVITYTAPVGTDDCPGAITTQTAGLASGETFPVGTTTNTFVVTDAAGLTATCSFDVTVNDTEDPVITCPANITQDTDPGVCEATVTYVTPTGTDNCSSGGSNLEVLYVVNQNENLTEIPNELTADGHNVTVVLDEYNNGWTTLDGDLSPYDLIVWDLSYSDTPATLNNIEDWVQAGGNILVTGYDALFFNTTTLTFLGGDSSSDFGGNNNLTVLGPDNNLTTGLYDIVGTSISGVDDWDTLDAPYTAETVNIVDEGRWTLRTITGGGQIAWLTSDYGDNGLWDTPGTGYYEALKNFAFNISSSSTTINQTVGLASGSTFPIGTTTNTFVTTDASGNTATCSFDVTVEDNEDPVWDNAPANLTVECDGAGNLTAFDDWLNSTFTGTDNCPDPIVTHNSTGLSDDCGATGSETVTFTLTDANSNAITLDATFTIEDTVDPFWDNAPADLTVECDGAGNTAEFDAWLNSTFN
ncbi:MAG: hypothetical protein ACI93P_001008, partial [bacterium]